MLSNWSGVINLGADARSMSQLTPGAQCEGSAPAPARCLVAKHRARLVVEFAVEDAVHGELSRVDVTSAPLAHRQQTREKERERENPLRISRTPAS